MDIDVDAVQHNVFGIADTGDEDCNMAIGGEITFL